MVPIRILLIASAGPLGIRFDAGDEIIWINGTAENSFRLTFGPTFRF